MRLVEAAGGIVWRRCERGVEVLLVHRPKYDDWTFPKGKLERGESHRAAARREVTEETGLTCVLGPELASARYADRRGRRKRARYWAMTVDGGAFRPNHEVDRVRWISARHAASKLSYEHDVSVLASFIEVLAPSARH